MPIQIPDSVNSIAQDEFHAIDRVVMGCAFKLHNLIGRLFDEKIYQKGLEELISTEALSCYRELEIKVSHQEFSKSYYLDLVVEGAIFETKATNSLTARHQAQLLNYLLLTESNHGKLINFRNPSVESRFISNQLTPHERHSFDIILFDDDVPTELLNTINVLLADLGTHLEVSLYKEALSTLLPCRTESIDITCNGTQLLAQEMDIMPDGIPLIVTGITTQNGINSFSTHLTRLLTNTTVNSLRWLNLNQHNVELRSIRK